MGELDNIPTQQQITIETAKLDEDTLKNITEINQRINNFLMDFGSMHIRKKEISEELIRIDEALEKTEDMFKAANKQIKELMDAIDEKYPQGRINLQDGSVQYQPGAPTRKQLEEQRMAQMNGQNQ
jgi:predicted  nucleic acid-binding Zn-ribbon protein